MAFQIPSPGKYSITASGSSPDERESRLNLSLANGVYFSPRPHWSGALEQGIKIDAVSTEQSYDVAPSDSEEWGTVGDRDTRIERATTYTALTVAPTVDVPYLLNNQSYVAENKLNSDNDDELVVSIGRSLGLTVDDLDGSQYMDAVISGFPTNVIDLYFNEQLGSVASSVDKTRGTVTLAGDNCTEVIGVLNTLTVILAHDDDRNFKLFIEGTARDSNGLVEVSDTYSLTHTVIVGAVADTPTLDAGVELKQLAAEGSDGNLYPVDIGLNDLDGSETYEGNSVDFSVSFPIDIANGEAPIVELDGGLTMVTEGPSNDRHYILTGTTADLDYAMRTLKITPGAHNGEDISVVVTVTSQESNPSETGGRGNCC